MLHALTHLLLCWVRSLKEVVPVHDASDEPSVHWGRYLEHLPDGRGARTHLRHL